MILSISHPGRPGDNARCESFLKTLKREEIHANDYRDYRDLEHLTERVQEFIESYYNRCRLHSALDYLSPDEFEKQCKEQRAAVESEAATVNMLA